MKSRMPAGLPQMIPDYPFNDVRAKEELVPDDRYQSRPSEMVQRKLQSVLVSSHIPISLLHTNRLVRR